MPSFVNGMEIKAGAIMIAQQGIIDPRMRCLLPGARIYRFGNHESRVQNGGWWLEEGELFRVQHWAKMAGLTFAHAYRVLGAIAHDYGAMRVGVLARVTAPLRAYEGRSRTQHIPLPGIVPGPDAIKPASIVKVSPIKEYLNPGALTAAPPINQLFIPGLCNRTIGAAAIHVVKTDYFDVGASHIGGVALFPDGAKVH